MHAKSVSREAQELAAPRWEGMPIERPVARSAGIALPTFRRIADAAHVGGDVDVANLGRRRIDGRSVETTQAMKTKTSSDSLTLREVQPDTFIQNTTNDAATPSCWPAWTQHVPRLSKIPGCWGVGKPAPAIFYTLSPEMPRHSGNADLDRLRGFDSHSCRSAW